MVGLHTVRIHIGQDGLIITLLWVTTEHNGWAVPLTSNTPRSVYVQCNVDLRNSLVVSAKTRGQDRTSVCDKLVWQGEPFGLKCETMLVTHLTYAAAEFGTETPSPMVMHAFRTSVMPPQRIGAATVQRHTVSGAVQRLLSRFQPTCGMCVFVLLDQRLLSNQSATPWRQAHIVLWTGRNKVEIDTAHFIYTRLRDLGTVETDHSPMMSPAGESDTVVFTISSFPLCATIT